MDAVLCVFSLLPSFQSGYGNVYSLKLKAGKRVNLICVEDIAEDEVEII